MAIGPSEGSRPRARPATPTRENIRRYLRCTSDDEVLSPDELVDYIHRATTWSPRVRRGAEAVMSVSHDYSRSWPVSRRPA